MFLNPSNREQKLLDCLTVIPPNFAAAESRIRADKLNQDEINRVALVYVHACFFEVVDYAQAHGIPQPTEIIPNLHSSYILDVIKFLLRFGLDANAICEDYNIMDSLRYIDNELLAADALALLLEYGGKTDLMIPSEGESFFDATDFEVFFAASEMGNRQLFASIVHCWMVMLGYGASYPADVVQLFKEYDSSEIFDLRKLKNHRNYYFGVTHLDNDFAISIYDKNTLWEVARIK